MELIRINFDSEGLVPAGCMISVRYLANAAPASPPLMGGFIPDSSLVKPPLEGCLARRWSDEPWNVPSFNVIREPLDAAAVRALNDFLASAKSPADVPLLRDIKVREPVSWTHVRPIRFEIDDDILAVFRMTDLQHFTPYDREQRAIQQKEADERAASNGGWRTASPGDWDRQPGRSLLTTTGKHPLGMHTHFPPGLFGRNSPGLEMLDMIIGRDDEIVWTGNLWGYQAMRCRATLWCEIIER